ncbi:unnamed protein product, partial [Tetraodon nigroviridis]
LKSPAAFHEQRRSLERARTEDYLKRKIRSRPMRSELVRMHILEDSPKGAGGESSSLDEDSSDALSPDQPTNHDSPSSAVPQLSPSDMLSQNGDMSPSQVRKQKKLSLLETLSLQFITQSPPPPLPPQVNGSESPVFPKVANGLTGTLSVSRSATGQLKSQAKTSAERPPQRSKKLKDSKPKVKKLKYHQYIPRDQKADKERPRQMDSSYAKLLQQQQLFLQLQILSQQQQHYNYHTILRAPPKSASEPPPTTSSGPSPSRSISTPTTPTPSSQNTAARQSQTAAGGAKPSSLPANLDEFKVAELKQELKLRGLTVSGTKNDLIERLRNYQEQNGSKSCKPQPGQQTLAVSPFTTPPTTVPPSEQQPGEVGFKLALSPLTQMVPGRVMRFGSTSSSPPLSPCPSERSLAGMSPDETSCNGDMFGEMVSSPLTQLTLHPSPQHPPVSTMSQPLPQVKEETQSSCSLARPLAAACQASESLPSFSAETIDKDQMLQEKDKQIEELTRMLRQKQRLVETLRSQLEQGKLACGSVLEKEGGEKSRASPDSEQQTLMRASPLQAPNLQNDLAAKVKKEVECEEEMEGITEEAQVRKTAQPTQCSQETLLRLQQIQRLQVQQAVLQKQTVQQTQMQVQEKAESKPNPQKQQQPKKEAPSQLLQQQQQLQQLIIQQTQQKQLQAQQKLAEHKLIQQKQSQQKLAQQNQLRQTQGPGQQSQQKAQPPLKQVQVHIQKPLVNQIQQRRQLKAQHRQQHRQPMAAVPAQQVAPVIINQQNGSQIQAQTISLDLLKANGAPTLVTDSNGNHYLIALTTEGQNGVSLPAKTNGHIMLQRLQSTPAKLPSSESQSKKQPEAEPVTQPIKKGQKAGLHLDTSGVPQPSQAVTAPPGLQPFFHDASDGKSRSSFSSLKVENGMNSQQMDDLFDILLKSGGDGRLRRSPAAAAASGLSTCLPCVFLSEIPGLKSNPDPSLAPVHSDPSSSASPPFLLPPIRSPSAPLIRRRVQGTSAWKTSSTPPRARPLLGAELDGALTLIDDLHSQMLSTASILDHPPSPMDTSDLGFSTHSAGLDFDHSLDSMDWLDISTVGNSSGARGTRGRGGGDGGDGGTDLAPLAPHTPPSVFSTDFLDSTDLQLNWE